MRAVTTIGVCWGCRKCYSQFHAHQNEGKNSVSICPDCKTGLSYISTQFKIPKRNKIKEWIKLKRIYASNE